MLRVCAACVLGVASACLRVCLAATGLCELPEVTPASVNTHTSVPVCLGVCATFAGHGLPLQAGSG